MKISLLLLLCLQVSVLSKACSDFLIGTMDLYNCLSLLSLAEGYGSASLLQSANEFVVQNFFELSKTQDFLDMQVKPNLAPKHCVYAEKGWRLIRVSVVIYSLYPVAKHFIMSDLRTS